MTEALVLSAMAGISVTLVIIGISGRKANESSIDERLERYASREVEMMEESKRKRVLSRETGLTNRLNRSLSSGSSAQKIASNLARADLKMKVSEFILLNLATVLLGFLIGYLIFSSLLFALAGTMLGYFAPRLYVSYRQRRRLNAFNDQLSDSINLLVNSLRSGYSLLQSMEVVSRELPAPISVEFSRVVQEISLGLSTEQAMKNMLRRIQSDDLDMMITAINVQHEVGGNLAEILETISHTIRERVRIKGEIRVLTAQQMITAYLISFLPVGLGVILYLINKEYIGLLFSEACGWIQVAVAVTIITIGFLIIRKIVDIEV